MACPYCNLSRVPYGGEDMCECQLSSCCDQPVDVACDREPDDDTYDDQDEEEW